MLTISQIEEKEFKCQRNGYSKDEVDEFLDTICDTMEEMQAEMANLRAELIRAQNENRERQIPIPTPVPAPAFTRPDDSDTRSSESSVKLLEKAQKMYDDIIAEARAKAEKICGEARSIAPEDEAEMVRMNEEKADLEDQIAELKAAAQDYRRRFRQLLEDQNHLLNSEKQLFE